VIKEKETKSKVQTQKMWEPKIVAFLCNWCSYAGADLAGVSRLQYPTNVRIIRLPCSGRMNPFLIFKAFQKGADGVLVSGCHPGDCHYISGNLIARRKFALLKNFLPAFGLEPERLQFSWVSAAEGEIFAQIIEKITEEIKKLGPLDKFKKNGR
jgi:coenzyme F420-reducing hydrogenase delta subunit